MKMTQESYLTKQSVSVIVCTKMDRDTGASLVFGSGRHHCLGSSPGQLELRVALEETVGLVADYDVDAERIERIHSSNNRGFASLPTRVTPR